MTISRRQFMVGAGVTGAGLLAACGRLPWRPEPPPARAPRLGVLLQVEDDARPAALRQGLRELGYVEGDNITIAVQSTNAQTELLPLLAAELIQMPVDIMVVPSATEVRAVRQVSDSVPIVFTFAIDPVGMKVVESFARPGGNTTGLSNSQDVTAGKRLEFLKLA